MNGRPEWEKAGVQFVSEVGAYEKMKIRLLNAGHSLLGFAGFLSGYQTIDESVKDPDLEKLLRAFMNREVTPILGSIQGMDLTKYKESLIERFGNPYIRDHLSRICGESSAKIPKFLIPTIQDQLERGGPIAVGAFVVAAWSRLLEMTGIEGFDFPVEDVMKEELIRRAKISVKDDPLAFLRLKNLFGDLVNSSRFVDVYLEIMERLRRDKLKNVIKWILSSQ
jgi:mannitol 2-dehydrogenase